MDRSSAIIGLRGTSRAVAFDQGRTTCICNNEGCPNFHCALHINRWNRGAPPTASTPWGGSILGDISTSTVLDGFGRPVLEKLIHALGSLRQERLHMILIGPNGEYICDNEVAAGDDSGLSSKYRPLIEHALMRSASSIILVHNHPSGDHRPSCNDLVFTRRFAALCTQIDLKLTDHLIVAMRSVFSMKRSGLL